VPNHGYRQIADQLREAIESGDLAAGALVASEAELARQHGVARTTARRALAQLEEGGYLSTAVGKGRFVRSRGGPVVQTARFERVAEALRQQILQASVGQAVALGTEAELATRFDVSQGTIRRALRLLERENLAAAVPGRGWFARPAEDLPTLTALTAEKIRSAIKTGEWLIGDTLPGEVALAAQFGVGRVTVRRAFALLEDEGLVERRLGRGRLLLKRA
jgi:DNA-binding GntR family transcriptional regulator